MKPLDIVVVLVPYPHYTVGCAHASRRNRHTGQAQRHERRSRADTEYGEGENQPSVALMGVLGGMLAFDPAERLSAQECLLREDVFGGGGGGDAVVNVIPDAAGSSATGMSRGSSSREVSSGVAKGYGSDETVGAVLDQLAGGVGGGGSGSNGIGIGDDFKAAFGGQDCDRTAETVSDLYDDNSVVEMESGVVNGNKDDDDNNNNYDDGGYDDDEYETADDDGENVEETRAASVDEDAATGRGGSARSAVGKLQRRHQEQLEEQTLPPQEKALLGETGFVRKRVVEIEEKEEYFSSIGIKKNAPAGAGAGAGAETTTKQEPPADACDDGSAATVAASEGAASDIGNRESFSCSSSSLHKDAGDHDIPAGCSSDAEEPAASTVQSPADVDKGIPSYRAFDSLVAVVAAVAAAIAAEVTADIINAALADLSGARQRETSTDCSFTQGGLREGGGRKLDDSGDYTSTNKAQLKENDPEAEGKTEGDITRGMMFGDEGYGSDSFDEGEEEDKEGPPSDIGGRTSFFLGGLGSTATVADKTRTSGSGIVTGDTSSTAPDAGGLPTSQNKVQTTLVIDGSGEKPSKSRGERTEDNVDTQQDNGMKAVIDEAAGKDEGEDGDGWRVAGAFRVLAASGPGGELAAKAVKALLREQGRQPPRLLAGEPKRWGGAS